MYYYSIYIVLYNVLQVGLCQVPYSNNKSPVQFRAPDITMRQLQELSKKWGENRSKVIIRCIERAWLNEKSSQQELTIQSKGKENA
jgi:EAL domain-containing protein (putative c-di-GMP-specific phosphodiesterase class I)